jgi:hypothetical protein
MLDAGGGPNFVQETAAVCRQQWLFAGRVSPLVRLNRTYDFSKRLDFGLNIILDALTRSIQDNDGNHSPWPSTVRSPHRKNPLRKPTPLRMRRS